MFTWLAQHTEPIADRILSLVNYDRLSLWKKFLYYPGKVLPSAKKEASLKRAIYDIAMCSLWYFVGIFWLIALSANSPLIFGFDGWLISAFQKSAVLIAVFFLAIFSHWLITNALEYFLLSPNGGKIKFHEQSYLSALSFGSMAVVQMMLQLLAHALALLLAALSVAAILLGSASLSDSMLNALNATFLFSSVFFPLLLQVFRILMQEQILTSRAPLGNSRLAVLVAIEFASLFAVFSVAAIATVSILNSSSPI